MGKKKQEKKYTFLTVDGCTYVGKVLADRKETVLIETKGGKIELYKRNIVRKTGV